MRVFCPEHNRGFFAPRQNPIKCGNGGHILGELDFAGQAKPPGELRWQYCCNCEHFSPMGFRRNDIERCAVCARQSSTVYLCNRCYTISFESNNPVQTKNFTLSSEGAPQPSCPGCLGAATADLREHTCDKLGTSLMTALNSCPICEERLDIGPSFPCSVAYYLKRTKAGNKLNVTFDYESELFVSVDDGEFVLIRNGTEPIQPILLPRSSRFAAKEQFYNFYQDYYHCTEPGTGEVQIIEPAAVEEVEGGWKLQTPGTLEVLEDHPEKKAPAPGKRPKAASPARESTAPPSPPKQEPAAVRCTDSGSVVESRYAFCWHCGQALRVTNKLTIMRPQQALAITPSAEVITEAEEPTVVTTGSPIFSWALPREPEWPSVTSGSALKLIGLALVVLLVVSLGLFGLFHSSGTGSASPTQTLTQEAQSAAAPVPEAGRNLPTESTLMRTSTARPEDNELKELRQRRITAQTSDSFGILEAFAKAEKRYPNDYRFPYERAKFAINARETHAHDEAFAALSLAAEKAIATGKAHEMLDSLQADKNGDFHKLSHGHAEWTELQKMLESNAKKLSTAKAQV